MVVVATEDGRGLNGIVKARNDRTMTLQTQNEEVTLDRSAIAEEPPSTASLMRDGVLSELSEDQVRELVAYLQGRTQMPLPGSPR
jgi:putative heme-binding domain-containing protein